MQEIWEEEGKAHQEQNPEIYDVLDVVSICLCPPLGPFLVELIMLWSMHVVATHHARSRSRTSKGVASLREVHAIEARSFFLGDRGPERDVPGAVELYTQDSKRSQTPENEEGRGVQ